MHSLTIREMIITLTAVAALAACRNPDVSPWTEPYDADVAEDADAAPDGDAEPEDADAADADGPVEDADVSDGDVDGETDPREILALCLTESGAVLYGAYWCSACHYQKYMFAPYHELLDYVDCYFDPEEGILDDMKQECYDVELVAFPTWIFGDGSRWEGTATFEQLAEMSGCEWLGPPTEDCGG